MSTATSSTASATRELPARLAGEARKKPGQLRRLPAVPSDPAGRELLAHFYRALGDPSRLSLLAFCAVAERTGNECVDHVGLSQGRVSAHLACLVSCGLVTSRREGRYVYYRVENPKVAELVRLGVEITAGHAASIAECAAVAKSR